MLHETNERDRESMLSFFTNKYDSRIDNLTLANVKSQKIMNAGPSISSPALNNCAKTG
jgi:hypothetical protein